MTRSSTSPEPALPSAPRLLAIRFSALGDVLLTLPAVQALRGRWPDAHIAFMTDTRFAGLFESFAAIDEIRTLDRLGLKAARLDAVRRVFTDVLAPTIAGRWDAVVDFQGFSETALITRLSRARVRVGRHYKTRARFMYTHWIDAAHADVYMPENHLDTLVRAGLIDAGRTAVDGRWLSVSERARKEWNERAGGNWRASPRGGRVALFVGAAKAEKRWPAARFAELAARLAETSADALSFVVLAGAGEQQHAETVVTALAAAGHANHAFNGGVGSLGALAAALDDCSLTISNDTGPMHISVAVGTPTLGIFRRTMPHFTPPAPHRAVTAPAAAELTELDVAAVLPHAKSLLGATATR